jgi:hypothetical protein
MKTIEKPLSGIEPKATPSSVEIAAWEALPHDEQLRRLRDSFSDPACSRAATRSMNDLLAAARDAVKHE